MEPPQQLLFGLHTRGFLLLALGDLLDHARHAHGAPVVAVLGAAVSLQPMHAAVGPEYALGGAIVRTPAFQAIDECQLGGLDVVRMKVLQVVGKTPGESFRREAEKQRSIAIPLHAIRAKVPDPSDDAERFLREPELLGAFAQTHSAALGMDGHGALHARAARTPAAFVCFGHPALPLGCRAYGAPSPRFPEEGQFASLSGAGHGDDTGEPARRSSRRAGRAHERYVLLGPQ